MNQTLELQQQKTAALTEASAILAKAKAEDNRALTPEERSSFDALETKVKDIAATLDIEQRMATLSNIHSDGPTRAGNNVHNNMEDNPCLFGREASGSESPQQRRRRLSFGLGQQLMAIKNAEIIQHSASGGKPDERLFELQRRAAAAGASEQVPSDGGFLLQPDFGSEILYLAHETGLVFPRATNIPISDFTNAINIPSVDEQSRVDGSRFGGVRMYWENEADALTGSRPKFSQIQMVLKKLTGLYYATSEVLADAKAMGTFVMMAFGQEMGFKMDDGCIRGSGAGQLLGFLNSPSLITVAKESGQAAATVVAGNIFKMWSRMWSRSKPNAVWLVNADVVPQLPQLVIQGTNSGVFPIYMPPGGISGAQYGTIFGRPVIEIEQADTVGTTGDIMLADMSQFLTIDKGDMQTAVSMHVRFLTDEQTFRWIYRTDGQPWWRTALTPFKGVNTLSPFVVLANR